MNPKVTLVAEGQNLDRNALQSAFAEIPEMKVREVGPDRGVGGILTGLRFVAELVAPSVPKVVDKLLEQRKLKLAGAKLKVKVGPVEIELENANRGDLIQLMEKASELAKKGEKL